MLATVFAFILAIVAIYVIVVGISFINLFLTEIFKPVPKYVAPKPLTPEERKAKEEHRLRMAKETEELMAFFREYPPRRGY